MFAKDYLTLQLVRLKTAEEWSHAQKGLAFVFPRGGAGRHVWGKESLAVVRGDVLVFDGVPGGRLCAEKRGELVFATFSVCLENLFPLFASHEIPLLEGVIEDFKRPKFYPSTSPLALECHRLLADVPPQFNLDHRGHLLRVAASVLALELKHAHGRRVGVGRTDDHLIQVFEKISSAELLGSSVEELAARFSCSRRHLNRLFHQHFGLPLAAIRMEMRLLKAVSLLRNPGPKVINVAEECGFNHLGLFNTCFKRRFGHSPGQWRKLSAEAKIPADWLAGNGSHCPLQINGLCAWATQAQKPVEAKSASGHDDPQARLDLAVCVELAHHHAASQRTGMVFANP
jgi:AraC-like DNA-binding protein